MNLQKLNIGINSQGNKCVYCLKKFGLLLYIMIEWDIVINNIIKNYNYNNPDYLEIGVQHGITFNKINSSKKDGVDPCIYGSYDFINYKMTSDIFFKEHINKKYDIIFIDGLHTAYQVTKDIYNSINCLKNGGIIILDDVYPHSENE